MQISEEPETVIESRETAARSLVQDPETFVEPTPPVLSPERLHEDLTAASPRPQAAEREEQRRKIPWGWIIAGAGGLGVVAVIAIVIAVTAFGRETETPAPTPEPTGLPASIAASDGAKMVLVSAGPFEMGSEADVDRASPIHTVTLDDYYFDQYEVTNAQYAAFLNEQGNQSEGDEPWHRVSLNRERIHERGGSWQIESGYGNYPVMVVSWYGAQSYCAWRGDRLPTEAEWEKAARGDDGREYPWGNESPSESLLNSDFTEGDIVPVGSYPDGASPYGVYDMAGNVWEWVADWHDADFYGNSPDANPSGPSLGELKVLRGGAWPSVSSNVRSAYRSGGRPLYAVNEIGFRCARGTSPANPTEQPTIAATSMPASITAADGAEMMLIPPGRLRWAARMVTVIGTKDRFIRLFWMNITLTSTK